MKEFKIVYKNGQVKTIAAPDRKTLIEEQFKDSQSKFESEVKKIAWSSLAVYYEMYTDTGEVNATLTSADVNPYGWRDA